MTLEGESLASTHSCSTRLMRVQQQLVLTFGWSCKPAANAWITSGSIVFTSIASTTMSAILPTHHATVSLTCSDSSFMRAKIGLSAWPIRTVSSDRSGPSSIEPNAITAASLFLQLG
ncbi:hypothetical protein OGATHE_000319 [Ogataea polymorpha]|uniref:Uncharacterized protein n=1 Tax=Ogataea polymorpha TaxID=460523 RepID=A0A9P8PU40_9ASCO|nr:hypothetical protein OGATHE_000319 [Ogataea polymorpha]